MRLNAVAASLRRNATENGRGQTNTVSAVRRPHVFERSGCEPSGAMLPKTMPQLYSTVQ